MSQMEKQLLYIKQKSHSAVITWKNVNNIFHIYTYICIYIKYKILSQFCYWKLCSSSVSSHTDKPPNLDSAAMVMGAYPRNLTLEIHCIKLFNCVLQLFLENQLFKLLFYFLKPNYSWIYCFFNLVLFISWSSIIPAHPMTCPTNQFF